MVESWVFEENLRPLLQFAGSRVEYAFDNLDWDAVRSGVEATDADNDRWFTYELSGHGTVTVDVAQAIGDAKYLVRFASSDAIERDLGVVLDLMTEFWVVARDPPQA